MWDLRHLPIGTQFWRNGWVEPETSGRRLRAMSPIVALKGGLEYVKRSGSAMLNRSDSCAIEVLAMAIELWISVYLMPILTSNANENLY